MANMGWNLPPEDGMSDLVMDILGILEEADTPTELNDQIVKLIEDWEDHKRTDEEVAVLMGWCFNEKVALWMNTSGGPVSRLPAFSSDPKHAGTVIRFFREKSFFDKSDQFFFERYKKDMTPLEICNLAISVMTKGWP